MGVGRVAQRITSADNHPEFAPDDKVKELRQSGLQACWRQKWKEGEPSQGLVLGDEAKEFGHTELKALDVESAIDNDLAKGRQRVYAFCSYSTADGFVDNVGPAPSVALRSGSIQSGRV
jgi:hypothetical protein